MPLYDFRCEHCEGIFEQRVPIARISTDTIECNYCQQQTLAKPMITGHQQINMKSKWRPSSGAEQLAGPLVEGPGTNKIAHAARFYIIAAALTVLYAMFNPPF
jgi:putative FmdB family regulatory protein